VTRAAAAVALALVALAGCGGSGGGSTGPDVDYSFTSNGVLKQHAETRISSDGTVTATNNYKPGCPASPATAKLDKASMDRLQKALDGARLSEQESDEQPGANGQELEIRSGGVTYRHVGNKPLPRPVQPLVSELSRITAWACDPERPAAP
jgi:hypothetical protein